MNFNTIKQELHKKIKMMSKDDFDNFISELKRIYYKGHVKRNWWDAHYQKDEDDEYLGR